MSRAYCYRCMKPGPLCVCARVPRVPNRTDVWVLQHPRERRHPVGTARLLELGLERVRVDVTFLRGPRALPPALPSGAAVLYPSPGAPVLDELPPDRRPTTLIALDGTWHQAHTLARDLPWLAGVPRVKLGSTAPSRYRIRKEPRAECVSTLEAVVAALRVLEPETPGLDALLGCFDSMIDDQLAFMERRSGPRRAKRRRASTRGVARAVTERWDDLLVVYAETARGPAGSRALVQLCAQRASGDVFDAVVRGPTPAGLAHMRLAAADVAGGSELAALRESWRRFRRPRDLVVAWNQSTLDALASAGLDASGLSLKALWANAVERAPGTLEAVIQRAGLAVEPAPVRGRAALRLGGALAVAHALRARAGVEP